MPLLFSNQTQLTHEFVFVNIISIMCVKEDVKTDMENSCKNITTIKKAIKWQCDGLSH